ncbi:hypothetical protein [Pseudomonas putida]|uniref:hypothetical protein n=1 Tax=Pseudomonas putida TaxID=303 RepID=UPI0021F82375|nr:hypothetical protein [Pseudomonas putida]
MKQNNFMTAFARVVERHKRKPHRQSVAQEIRAPIAKAPITHTAPAVIKPKEFDPAEHRAKVMTAFYQYMHKRGIK